MVKATSELPTLLLEAIAEKTTLAGFMIIPAIASTTSDESQALATRGFARSARNKRRKRSQAISSARKEEEAGATRSEP